MDANALKHRLAGSALEVCQHLFPRGRKNGAEFRVGGTDGQPGESLGIHLTGGKAGVWSDFATGEAGDLIDLWKVVRGLDTKRALDEIRAFLGVERPTFEGKQKKTYSAPRKPEGFRKADTSYLGSRGISPATAERLKIGQRGHTLYFPFIPADGGEAVMIKFRDTRSKDCGPTSKNQMPILFGWQAADPNARDCWIVEGEIDSASGYEMGIPACLSVPFGGGAKNKQGQWIENEYDNLDRFETIYLAVDMDAEGELAAQEIVNRLGAHRCVRVELPCKDLNECLQSGKLDWQSFPHRQFDPEELKRPTDFTDDVLRDLFPGEEDGIALPWRKADGKLYWRYSELVILNGINGHGKSQVLGHALLDISSKETADPETGECYRNGVCIYSGELRPGRLLSRMVRQANASRDINEHRAKVCLDWMDEAMLIFDLTGTAKTERLLEVFEYAYRRYGVKVFAIDSLMKCGIAVDDYNGQKRFVEALCDFKNKFDVLIFLVTHSRKVDDEYSQSGKMDVKGDSSITDLPDTVLSVWRNKPKELELQDAADQNRAPDQEVADEPDCWVNCFKQRNGNWEGSMGLFYDRHTFQYLGNADDKLFEYIPEGSFQ